MPLSLILCNFKLSFLFEATSFFSSWVWSAYTSIGSITADLEFSDEETLAGIISFESMLLSVEQE